MGRMRISIISLVSELLERANQPAHPVAQRIKEPPNCPVRFYSSCRFIYNAFRSLNQIR